MQRWTSENCSANIIAVYDDLDLSVTIQRAGTGSRGTAAAKWFSAFRSKIETSYENEKN